MLVVQNSHVIQYDLNYFSIRLVNNLIIIFFQSHYKYDKIKSIFER